jgi:hypothetical protein
MNQSFRILILFGLLIVCVGNAVPESAKRAEKVSVGDAVQTT